MHIKSNAYMFEHTQVFTNSPSSSSLSCHLRFVAVSDGVSGQQSLVSHSRRESTSSSRVLPPQTNDSLMGELTESS